MPFEGSCDDEASAYHLARGTWPLAAVAHERLVLPMEHSAAATARRLIEAKLHGVLDRDEEDILKLLVSELVTNAVRHSGAAADGSVTVHVGVARERIRVEVIDAGSGFRPAAEIRRPKTGARGGWGLVIVSVEAAAWGTATGGSFCVWFELARRAG